MSAGTLYQLWIILYDYVCLSVFQVTELSAGDVVRIVDDIATVHNLQENHGGWVDDMALVRAEQLWKLHVSTCVNFSISLIDFIGHKIILSLV